MVGSGRVSYFVPKKNLVLESPWQLTSGSLVKNR